MRFDERAYIIAKTLVEKPTGGRKPVPERIQEIECFLTPLVKVEVSESGTKMTTFTRKLLTKTTLLKEPTHIEFEGALYTVIKYADYKKLALIEMRPE